MNTVGKKIIFLYFFLFSLFLTAPVHAQDNPYQIEQYDFVRYKQNRLLFFDGPGNFERLFQSIDRLAYEGLGQVKIVHIGGSHLQADIFSDRVRQRLQTLAPGNNAGRGFVFPFQMAKTNNPSNYVTRYTGSWESCRNIQSGRSCDLGLSGISVNTFQPNATIEISFIDKADGKYDFNRVKVFHDAKRFNFEIRIANKEVRYKTQTNWNLGYTEFLLDRHLDTLELKVVRTNSRQEYFSLYGITLETDDPGFVYNAIGVNGASVPSFLRCRLMEKHIAALDPDLVIFSLGINDAHRKGESFSEKQFERNYDELISRIKTVAPEAAILFTTNNDSYYRKQYPNKNAFRVRNSMIRLAKRRKAAVWDLFGVMGGLNSISTWQRMGLAKADMVHFTRKGYQLLGDLLFNAIFRAYDNHIQQNPITVER